MTPNKTSQAVNDLLATWDDPLYEPHMKAIAEKYRLMEDKIQWTLEHGNINSKAILHLQSALSFDPLS